jgi:hypothetical protein
MNTLALMPFDYGVVSSKIAMKLQAQADRIKLRIRKTTEDIIEIGRDLLAVKDDPNVKHGLFIKWLENGVGITRRSAQRYMGAARLWEKNDTVTLLPPGVVYLLAAPSTPAEIIEAVTAKAAAGETVIDAAVKDMLADAKRKRREQEAIKRKADRRSRLSKRRRQEEEQRERARREDDEQRRADLAQRVVTVIGKIGIDGARMLCDMSEEHGPFAVMDALKIKIAEAA